MEKDVLLLLQGLQDEVRCESRRIRQVEPLWAAQRPCRRDAAQGVMQMPALR